MRKIKKLSMSLIVLLLMLMIAAVPAQAAGQKGWVQKNGRYYYYMKDGRLAKGTRKIYGKYYYFNSGGRQRNGWINSKGRYYYFRNEKGKGGYRLSSTTVNGIQLKANGQAVITSQNKAKLDLLVSANAYAYFRSNLNVTKEQRLRKCFEYMVNATRYRNLPHDFRNTADWPEYYASYIFYNKYGDCYCSGAAFAYVATALGFNNVYAVSSGGHGWCEIDGRAYDPNWARMTGRTDHYFGLASWNLQGNDPNYFKYGIYKRRIDN